MKYIIITLLVTLTFLSAYAGQDEDNAVLDTADKFFSKLDNNDYPDLWHALSKTSKNKIADDILDAYKDDKKNQYNITIKDIVADFDKCGNICNSYWMGFSRSFSAREVTMNSEWSIGKSEKDYYEIVLRNKKAQYPAILKIYKEDGAWKVGLTESFWLRKYFQ